MCCVSLILCCVQRKRRGCDVLVSWFHVWIDSSIKMFLGVKESSVLGKKVTKAGFFVVVVELASVTVQKKSWITVAGMVMWKGRGKHIVEQEVGKRVLTPREMQLPTKSTVRTMMLQGLESRADILSVWWGKWPCTWACGAGMTHREAARSPGSASVTAVSLKHLTVLVYHCGKGHYVHKTQS